MSYQTYSLTRVIDGGHSEFATSFTTSDDDAINCAHMLAAGFNVMSRNFMGDFVLGVVDTKTGSVQYDGKIEKIDRADKHRDVLESAYAELEAVKEVLFDAGVETIPADRGVTDLRAVLRARDMQISELVQELANRAVEVEELRKRDKFEHYARTNMERKHFEQNESARAEMIEYVKGAYAKLGRLDAAGERDDLQGRMRGMLDVLAKFLAVTGEADQDERHAVARRLCGIPEGTWA